MESVRILNGAFESMSSQDHIENGVGFFSFYLDFFLNLLGVRLPRLV